MKNLFENIDLIWYWFLSLRIPICFDMDFTNKE